MNDMGGNVNVGKNGRMLDGNGALGTGAFDGKKINFSNAFVTEVFYKNATKETVNHIEPPVADANRMLHFKVSLKEGLCIKLDDVRRFVTVVKSIAVASSGENGIT